MPLAIFIFTYLLIRAIISGGSLASWHTWLICAKHANSLENKDQTAGEDTFGFRSRDLIWLAGEDSGLVVVDITTGRLISSRTQKRIDQQSK